FIYLEMNGNPVRFPTFSPNHLYTFTVPANGQQLHFVIRDCSFCYPDNAGNLRIEILQGTNLSGHSLVNGVVNFQQHSLEATSGFTPDRGNWGLTPYGISGSIDEWGCILSDWAMLINSVLTNASPPSNFRTDPYLLNQWLKDNH